MSNDYLIRVAGVRQVLGELAYYEDPTLDVGRLACLGPR